ncbi:MAG: hypothetical protein LBT86_05545 [Deltaproteobacteria bacterium]|nr:hypothetical protein [Deltaproteobacteria bacterium]
MTLLVRATNFSVRLAQACSAVIGGAGLKGFGGDAADNSGDAWGLGAPSAAFFFNSSNG